MALKTIIIFLITTFGVGAQNFNGKWRVATYEDEMMIYYKSKDSISFKIHIDTEKEKLGFKELVDELIFTRVFEIDEKNFTMSGPVIGEVKSKYQIDYANSIIILISEEVGISNDKWPFKFIKDDLQITIPLSEYDMILGLEKI